MSGQRERFAIVGAALRASVERAAQEKLSDGERRTFEATIALVPSYSRLVDRVYVAEVAAISGLSERHTRACLTTLASKGIIVWEPRRGTGADGKALRSLLGLPDQTGTPRVPVSSGNVGGANRNPDDGKPEPLAFRRPRRTEEKALLEQRMDLKRPCRTSADAADDPVASTDELLRLIREDTEPQDALFDAEVGRRRPGAYKDGDES